MESLTREYKPILTGFIREMGPHPKPIAYPTPEPTIAGMCIGDVHSHFHRACSLYMQQIKGDAAKVKAFEGWAKESEMDRDAIAKFLGRTVIAEIREAMEYSVPQSMEHLVHEDDIVNVPVSDDFAFEWPEPKPSTIRYEPSAYDKARWPIN